MASAYFTEFPERDATKPGKKARRLTDRRPGPVDQSVRPTTPTTFKVAGKPRKVFKVLGRRVKTHAWEDY